MRTPKETKFGYGYLLVGWGLFYLVEQLTGRNAALYIALGCTVVGISLLLSGHWHERATTARRVLVSIVIVGTAAVVTYLVMGWFGALLKLPKPFVPTENWALKMEAYAASLKPGPPARLPRTIVVQPLPQVNQPPQQQIQIAPSYGNLKARCLNLSRVLTALYAQRYEQFQANIAIHNPIPPEEFEGWRRSTDNLYRYRENEVIEMRDDLARVNLEDNELNALLRQDEENSRYRNLRPQESLYGMGWMSAENIKSMGERFAILANQIP